MTPYFLEMREQFESAAKRLLEDKTIKHVGYEDIDNSLVITLILSDGTKLWVSSDEEFNHPGVIFTNNDSLPCIPAFV